MTAVIRMYLLLPILLAALYKTIPVSTTNTSVLIIGSSISGMVAAYELSRNNCRVAWAFTGSSPDNMLALQTNIVHDRTFTFPNRHPVIFKNFATLRKLAQELGLKMDTEKHIELIHPNGWHHVIESGQSMESIALQSFFHTDCLSIIHFPTIIRIVDTIKRFNFNTYSKYRNMTLAQFGKTVNAPADFYSCYLKSAILNSADTDKTMNAFDAIQRMYTYFFKDRSSLENSHLSHSHNSSNNINNFYTAMMKSIQKHNVKLIPNHQVKALRVNVYTGQIEGDFSENTNYNYTIIAESTLQAKSIINTTMSMNTGVPKTFVPLDSLITKLTKFSQTLPVAVVKIWLDHGLNIGRARSMQVIGSKSPNSLHSITTLTPQSGDRESVTTLELFIGEASSPLDWYKIQTELFRALPEISNSRILLNTTKYVVGHISKDVKFANYAVPTTTGISNLFLASDCTKTTESHSVSLDNLVSIGLEAASKIKKLSKI